MALPLLLVGAALLTGTIGVAKGVSAKRDFDEAEDLNEEAKQTFNDAKESLKEQRDRTQARLEHLGETKLRLHQSGLKPFVDIFSQIKNVDYTDVALEDLQIGEEQIFVMQKTVMNMEEVVGGISAIIGGSALAGLATYGSVGLLGTASTGTAIAGLSGVAATNATLAWLGGGSLAVGGAGMAGGAVVLGGIVAAPVLLVGGLILSSKATEALESARSNLAKAETAAEEMETAEVATKAIRRKADEVSKVLKELLDDYLDEGLLELDRLVSRNDDYRTYSDKQKRVVMRTAAVAKTAHLVAEAPLFDEEGVITNEIRQALRIARQFLRTVDAM